MKEKPRSLSLNRIAKEEPGADPGFDEGGFGINARRRR